MFKPQDVYPDVKGLAPDLIVYFGDLEWRSVGSVGNPSIYTYENDTGEPIYWGLDYWTAEMCWAAMYLYPAETQTSACSAN